MPRAQRRVVVTGLGAISSLGNGADTLWESLLEGKSGIRAAENLDPEIISSTIRGDVDDEHLPNRFLDSKTLRNTSRFARMAIEAAGEALIDAGLIDKQTLEASPELAGGGAVIG
ncbi:MAG TPA: beta-ketoacyl synthase N-terminal-like domain-containing protein, partial [Lautropia sp.]|nr:beta-ketoacyl synthase N-terminal-like domain-containing protein [Lautropia sp.]